MPLLSVPLALNVCGFEDFSLKLGFGISYPILLQCSFRSLAFLRPAVGLVELTSQMGQAAYTINGLHFADVVVVSLPFLLTSLSALAPVSRFGATHRLCQGLSSLQSLSFHSISRMRLLPQYTLIPLYARMASKISRLKEITQTFGQNFGTSFGPESLS